MVFSEEESLARFYRQKQAHLNDVLDITEADLIANRAGKLSDSQQAVAAEDKSTSLFGIGWTLSFAIGGFFSVTRLDLELMNGLAFLEYPLLALGVMSVPGILLLGIGIWSWWVLHEHHVDAQRAVVFAYRGKPKHMGFREINVGKSERISVDSEEAQAAFTEDLTYMIYVLPRTKKLVGAEVLPLRDLDPDDAP